MTAEYLLKGLIIGFSVAIPVGPISVLIIKRTLTEGLTAGFVTGMGAAVADTMYGLIAGLGLTAVSAFLVTQSFWLKMIGGLFLLYLGVVCLLQKPAAKEAGSNSRGLLNHFVSTFFLTVTNPATILSFLAIFAGLGMGTSESGYTSSAILVAGVFMGSALWSLVLSSVASIFRSGITPARLIWLNRLSGIMIMSFGLWAIYSGFIHI